MWKATVKGIVGRRVRLALTGLAVVLGVAFVTGTFVLTDTLTTSFQGVYRQTLAGVDLVVRARPPPGGGGGAFLQRFPDTVTAQARAVPGVGSATSFVTGYAQFVDQSGHAISSSGAPTLGINWADHGSEGPLHLVADGARRGRAPTRPGEVAMDAGTARRYGFHVGDRVDVLLQGPKQRFEIVGLFALGDQADLGPITFAAFDLRTAQRVFGAPGQLDAAYVTLAPHARLDRVQSRLTGALGPFYEVDPPAQVATTRGQVVLNFVTLLGDLLLGFTAIGMVIAAFIIFNTFTILVTQRLHELGLLRALGASGPQVIASVLGEAAVIGAAGAAVGVGIGYGLAVALLGLADRLGFAVPSQTAVLESRTVLAAFGVGLGVTVLSSLWPGLRAARVSPLAAVTDARTQARRPLARRAVVGLVVAGLGVPAILIGLHRTQYQSNTLREVWWVAAGAVLVLAGVLVLLAAVAGPFAGLLARPLRAAGVVGTLARANAIRNPRRTAATASALVIGLALVGLVAIFGQSAKASISRAVSGGIRADLVLKAQQFASFSPTVAQRVAQLDPVAAVTAFRFGNVRVPIGGNQETVAGASPAGLTQVVDLGLRQGSVAAMGNDGVLVSQDASRQYHLGVGSLVGMQFPNAGPVTLRVAGIYTQRDFTGGFPVGFIVSEPAYEQGFGTATGDTLVYVRARPGETAAAGAALHRALAASFPNISVYTRAEYAQAQEQTVDRVLAVTIALLMLSEIIAVLGIVNTLALSVFERTRELGLLRVVGMSRRQLRRMIRGESVVVALLGGLVGTGLGVLWGWVFTRALRAEGLTVLRFPTVELVAFVALSVVAGVVAALAPAWRAARLDVLEAIATE
ncbi:MAG TPA: ABC transporter permease [Acidimicrobiia bacterium]